MSASNNSTDAPVLLSRRKKKNLERLSSRLSPISIAVELERENRVYYPGDVVKGLVRLKVPVQEEPTRCHGVYLVFHSIASVFWEDNSGDSTIIRRGQTVFQQYRRTLTGCYTTGLVPTLSSAPGAGTVLLPVTASQLLVVLVRPGRLNKLIVLGQANVDVHTLLQSTAEPRDYPLVLKGKVTQTVSLSGQMEREPLDPNSDDNNNNADPLLHLRIDVREVKGMPKSVVMQRATVRIYILTEGEDPPDVTTNDMKTVLRVGETVFPFCFQLRNDAPGTGIWKVHGSATVLHVTEALVDMRTKHPWEVPGAMQILTVVPNRPLPLEELLSPYQTEILDQQLHNCHCCGFRSCKLDGLLSIRLSLGRLAYAPGELVDLTNSQVKNDTSSTLPLQVILRCHIERRANLVCNKVRLDMVLLVSEIHGNQSVSLRNLGQVRIPAVYPAFDGGVSEPYTWELYACLKWSYTIEIRVGGDTTSYATGVSCRTPVLICAAPPYTNQIEAARSQRPSLDLTDAMSIFRYATTEVSLDCVTAPTIRGPTDGGHIAPAIADHTRTLGMMASSHDLKDYIEGAIQSSWLPTMESAGFSYKPVVNTFDDPGTASSPGPDVSSEDLPASMVPTTAANSVSPTESVVRTANIEELLHAMDESSDQRGTVREWIRDHPNAEQLQPHDFASVLSHVRFTLDQSAVVKELMVAFEKSSLLSCHHIVAVMEVCTYEKSEVARLMAPSVNDPENKGLVLRQIEWQLERESLERLFR
jgi:hypothetical protein